MKKLFLILNLLLVISFEKIFAAGNEWQKIESFAGTKRERMVGFSIGGRGYIGTGQDSSNAVKRDFWEYDPSTNSWTQKANFGGIARRDAVGISIGNKGYIGTGISNAESFLGSELADWWEYNPVTNTWLQRANYPGNFGNGIYYSTGFTIGSKAYLATGKIGPSSYSSQLYEYDPATNLWTQKTSFPGGVRYGCASFSVNGKGYVGTGSDENMFTSDWWEYTPTTNSWTQAANLPGSPRFACTGFAIGNFGYIVLGTDGGYKDELWEYDPSVNSWNVRNAYDGDARRSATGFVIGNYAYVGTGKGLSGTHRDFRKYTPWYPDGIAENYSNSNVSLYPNPMSETATLEIKIPINHTVFRIYSISGSLIRESEILNQKSEIRKDGMASGIYLYEVSSGEKIIASGKLIVQ